MRLRAAVAIVCVLATVPALQSSEKVPVERPRVSQSTNRLRLSESYGRLPLGFEANRGQTDGDVKFVSRGPGYTLFLTSTEAVLALRKLADRASRTSVKRN